MTCIRATSNAQTLLSVRLQPAGTLLKPRDDKK